MISSNTQEIALSLIARELSQNKASSIRGMSREADIPYSTLYFAIRQLENNGYIAREKGKDGAIQLTEKGKAYIQKYKFLRAVDGEPKIVRMY